MSGEDGPAVVVSELRKRYGEVVAADGVSFDVEEGEFFGILGPNGAGKTTVLELVEGLREPDSGSVRMFGEPTWPRNTTLLPRMGVQLQASAFFERLTAREQVVTFASLYGTPPKRADEVLEAVGLTEKAGVREDELSGGQRQRLSIACALVHDPEIVFLDEPTAALDPQARRNLWAVLRDIQRRGRTIVYTTHYLDEAEVLCDRVAIMDAGALHALDAPATLVRGLDAPTRIIVRRDALGDEDVAGLPAVEDVTEDDGELTIATHEPAEVLDGLARRDALHGLRVRTATLEDVFLELTGQEYRS